MAISWQYKIPPFMLTGNTMPIWLKSNNLFSSAGTKATMYFYDNGNALVGETFTLVTPLITLAFTCAAVPDSSGFQYRPYQTGQTRAQFLDQLYADLLQNYYLHSNYAIQRGTQGATQVIRLTALNAGTDYSFTSATADYSKFIFAPTAGADKVRRANFKINLQVWKVETSGNVMIGEDSIAPDNTGLAMFDIAEYFQPVVKGSFVFPDAPLATPVYVKALMSGKYFLRYNERYGEPPVDYAVTDTGFATPFYAVVGAIDDTIFRQRYQANSTNTQWNLFRPNFHGTLFWLTNQPNNKLMRKWQQEKLYFFTQKTANSIQVRVKVTKVNDTTAEHTAATFANAKGVVYEVSAGYKALRLDNIYGVDQVKAWEVYVRDAVSLVGLTPNRSFALKEEVELHERQFIFRNKLGAFDVAILTGDQSSSYNYERSGFELEDTNPNPFVQPITESKLPKKDYRIQANTGFLNKAQLRWMRELMESPEVYEVLNNRLHVAKITSDSIQYSADRNGTRAINFEYERAEGDAITGGVGDMSIGFNFLIQ